MHWNELISAPQLETIDGESASSPVLILKHSSRCNISAAALARIERKWTDENSKTIKPYFLDLLKYPDISNAITQRYGIEHESPQALLIIKGNCVVAQSHLRINLADLLAGP